MEFTEEELRHIEQSGRLPRSPDAHQPDLGPRGWLAPPPSDQSGGTSRRRRFEELDETVDAAFGSVRDKPAGLVQWLDANVLVTDHGAGDPPSPAPGPTGDGSAVSGAPPPPPPARLDSRDEIPVDVELDVDSTAAPTSEETALGDDVTDTSPGKPAAVDAVFRALAGGAADGGSAVGIEAGETTAPVSAVPDDGAGEQRAAVSQDMLSEEIESGTYEIQDTVSDVVGVSEDVLTVDEKMSQTPGPVPSQGGSETIRMPVMPMEGGNETVRMVPPPPPAPPVSVLPEAMPDGAGPDASGDSDLAPEGMASSGEEQLELDVELDSMTGLDDAALQGGGEAVGPSNGLDATAEKKADSVVAGPAPSSPSAAPAQPAAASDPQAAVSAPAASPPPPLPGDDKAPPPLPDGETAPPPAPPAGQKAPPVPAAAGSKDVSAPPPVPAVTKSDTAPGVPVPSQAPATGGQVDGQQTRPAKPPKPRDVARKKPWYQDFFDDDYLPTLPHETPESTLKEVEFLLSELSLPEQGHVLDLGCGYGRHAVEFAARGFSVVGLDNSLPMLIKAAQYCQLKGVEVEFVQEDMREMSFDGKFDAVYCFGTTFGYFGDDENRDVLKRMNQALKPGGRLVLEVVNRDYLLADLPLRVWWEGEACLVMDEVDFNYFTSRVEAHRTVVFNEGRQIERNMSIRVYSLHELGSQLFQAGFRVLKITGHMATRGRFLGMHSPHLIVTATKRG